LFSLRATDAWYRAREVRGYMSFRQNINSPHMQAAIYEKDCGFERSEQTRCSAATTLGGVSG
jgi:hypothetical protein